MKNINPAIIVMAWLAIMAWGVVIVIRRHHIRAWLNYHIGLFFGSIYRDLV